MYKNSGTLLLSFYAKGNKRDVDKPARLLSENLFPVRNGTPDTHGFLFRAGEAA